jgi:DNA-binding SARP family transcriptional activator/predicted ATPase
MELRLLGPIQVVDGPRHIELGSPKQRTLFALLALAQNQTVSRDRLVGDLWPEAPPDRAEHNVEVYVSRLRKYFPPTHAEIALETAPRGYRLRIDESRNDLRQFERLVAQARRERRGNRTALAVSLFEQALALWRGPALADVANEPAVAAHAALIDDLRVDAAQERLELEVAMGHTREVIPKIERLLAEHPAREELLELLMLALYRAGRQSDALRAYRRFRSALVEQVGIEPGPKVAALEREILRHSSTLAVPDSIEAVPGNLPMPASTLIGRDEEAEAIATMLRAGTRVTTLVGTGGIGKTRLAIAAAHAARRFFPHGAYFVDLSATSGGGVLDAISQSVGARLAAHESSAAALAAHLAHQRSLIVLDNFEHVLPAALAVRDLAEACLNVAFLITSREPLRLRGERLVRVRPMTAEAAFALFRSRVEDTRGAALRNSEESAAREICSQLEGLPLAIELAAGATSMRPAGEVLHEMRDAGPEAVGRAVTIDSPARHATLRSTFEWSAARLAKEERSALSVLTVFRGGADEDAVIRVAQAPSGTLAKLVDASLLERDESGRFRMLEVIRQLAATSLSPPQLRSARDKHAHWYLELAAAAESPLAGGGQREWLLRLDRDAANLSAAIDHLAHTDSTGAVRLVAALWRFYETRAPNDAVRDFTHLDSTSADAGTRARFEHALGRFALRDETYEEARQRFRNALAGAETAGDNRYVALALAGLGWVALIERELDASLTLCLRSVEIAELTGDEAVLAETLNNLGCTYGERGDQNQAAAEHGRAVSIRRGLGPNSGLAASLYNLATRQAELGNRDAARDLFRESLELSRELSDEWLTTHGLLAMAELAIDDGMDHAPVKRMLGEALARVETFRNHAMTAYVLRLLGTAAAMSGEHVVAGELWGAEEALSLKAGLANATDGAGHHSKRSVFEKASLSAQRKLEAARAKGAAMPLETALTVALAFVAN